MGCIGGRAASGIVWVVVDGGGSISVIICFTWCSGSISVLAFGASDFLLLKKEDIGTRQHARWNVTMAAYGKDDRQGLILSEYCH